MRYDLNLLTVFHSVAELKSVTLAADRLALSQSAVSHALNRLRETTGDQLFLRTKNGLQLTDRAQSMVVPTRKILDSAHCLMTPADFDPLTTKRRFRIAATDYASLIIVPLLLRRFREEAPNATLEIVAAGGNTLKQLEDGELDLSFWGAEPPQAPFHLHRLYTEHYVGLMSKTHRFAVKKTLPKLSLPQYLSCSHITVSVGTPGQNVVDQILANLGCARKISAVGHSFIGNVQCLKDTDLIATLPSRLCDGDHMRGLISFKLPINIPTYDYFYCWHRRTKDDLGISWLCTMLEQIGAKL